MDATTSMELTPEATGIMAMIAGMGMVGMLIVLAVNLLMLIAVWKIFSKAGKPGIAAIVPIWNIIVFLEIAQKPVWWIVLILLVPIANIICGIMALASLAKNFGKGGGFVAGMILLPVIFYPMLGFGSAEYQPAGAEAEVAE